MFSESIREPVPAVPLRSQESYPDPVALYQFDEDHSFIATTLMEEYYARLAGSWLGVPAGDLLPGFPGPFGDSA